MNELDLQTPGGGASAIIIFLVLGLLIMGIMHWRRQAMGRKSAILFTLRCMIIALVCIALMRPEQVHKENINRDPAIVILYDDTESMTPEDIIDGKHVISRNAWVEQIKSKNIWQPFEDEYKLYTEKLSDYSYDKVSEQNGSNLYEALQAIEKQYLNLRVLVIIGDGDYNLGSSPLKAVGSYRTRKVKIFGIGTGSKKFLPDLILKVDQVPSYCLLNEHVSISFTVQSYLERDIKTTITLKNTNGRNVKKDIFIPAGEMSSDSFLWKASRLGNQHLTIELPVQENELFEENNKSKMRINVRQEILNVLLVDSLPRWEYRFLKNALSRDPGIKVHSLLMHPGLARGGGKDYIKAFPVEKDKISKYDVVFIGDVGIGESELSKKDLEAVAGIVKQQGSGLVFLPGRRGRIHSFENTVFEEMLPVLMDRSKKKGMNFTSEMKIKLTRMGSEHLLTMLANNANRNKTLWKNLPGFYWNAGILKAKPGTDVLAVHGTIRNQWGLLPLLVTQSYGNGNILFMGTDSAWRWRRGVEDTYHYRFWAQVVRWMAHARHLSHKQGLRLFYSPEKISQGDTVKFQATVMDSHGFPVSDDMVKLKIISGEKNSSVIQLKEQPGGWGLYSAEHKITDIGNLLYILESKKTANSIEAEIMVKGKKLERLGQPARLTKLKELSDLTNGHYENYPQYQSVIDTISELPEEEFIIRRIAL